MIIGIGFVNLAKKYNSNLSMVTVLDTSGYWGNPALWKKAISQSKTFVAKEFESTAKKANVSF